MSSSLLGARPLPDRLPLLGHRPIILVGISLIMIQSVFRGWAIFNGWFYGDDFEFLTEAQGRTLTWSYLFTAHDSHLMPGGILASWLVAQSGPYNWVLAASILFVLQITCSLACLWMLTTLFGERRGILLPLAFYLFSPMTLTSYMWWASGINQLPIQATTFVAITSLALYLRDCGRRWALLVCLALAVGLFFHTKAVLLLGTLVLFALLYFTSNTESWPRRAVALLRARWRLWVTLIVIAVTYAAYYATNATDPLEQQSKIAYADLADAMLRISLGTSLLGGPWRWSDLNPPLGQVATSPWAVTLTWMVIASLLTYLVQRRMADLKALWLPISYLAVTYYLTARGRGPALGGFVGLELRYLADAAPVITLALALLFMRMRDQQYRHANRPPSIETIPPHHGLLSALLCVLIVGSAVSNVRYARMWTDGFPAETYVRNVDIASSQRPLNLADTPVPELVQSATSFPSNLPSELFAPLGDKVVATTAGNDLQVLSGAGVPFDGWVSGPAESPEGPAENCGFIVKQQWKQIPMRGPTPDYFWWLQVSYLANSDGRLTVGHGSESETHAVERGAHSLFVQGEGSIEPITLEAASPGLRLCVDRVAVGTIESLEPLS